VVARAVAALSLTLAACGGTRTSEVTSGTQCGPSLDFTPINAYQGDYAPAQLREDAVVLISGDCTGTLIAAAAGPVVLTAGHCVGLGDVVLAAFNVEDNPDGDPLATNGTVIEQATEPDYALIRLDELPRVTPTPLTRRPSDRIAIIQHPRSRPKVIADGDYSGSCNRLIFYTDLDTLAGSSGAGVLTQTGALLGIHTDGDCAVDGTGANFGWTAASIVEASAYLTDADIADR
jgi:hypothetical protein